jgi:hypothetical protein
MGAYSTLRITRSRAKAEILRYLMRETSDYRLEQFMDMILESHLYNANIVPDGWENDDAVLPDAH